jgi:putative transposase
MLKTKTYKYRLYPTREQIRLLEAAFDTCRILYNSCLLDRVRHYGETGRGLTRIRQQEILVADKNLHPRLWDVHSQCLQNVLFRVERAYAGFFRRMKAGEKPGYPRLKGEGRYDSITYPQEPGFKLTPEGLRLSKIGTVKIKLHRSLVGKAKTCTVRRDACGRWHASISVLYTPEAKAVPAAEVGIDVGIRHFACLSTGEAVENPRNLARAENKLAHLQRGLSRKLRGSKNRYKARLRVARAHRKVRDRRADFHHKITRGLVDRYGLIAVEDLRIRNMVKNRHLAKHIGDAGWGQFLRFLEYKAEDAGIRVERVAPRYTSILCSGCGTKVPKPLSVRIHRCPACGLVLDRDHNAAQNILLKATAGTAGINAWGEAALRGSSPNQEAPSLRAG